MKVVINKLIVKYNKQVEPALTIDHLSISEGIVAVIGENGAGKSTFFKTLQGFITPESGTIEKQGKSNKFSSAQVFQSEQAFDYATVNEWIEFQGLLRGISLSKPDIEDILKKAQLEGRGKHLVSKLSGGQQRKLNLLCASFGSPDLILLDEPTTGLDQEARKDYWKTIQDYRNTNPCALVFSSHYMDEVEENAQQVVLLSHGKVIEVGTPQELIDGLNFEYIGVVPNNKFKLFSQDKLTFVDKGDCYLIGINNGAEFFARYGAVEKLIQDGIQIRNPDMSDVYTFKYKGSVNNG